jgi:hypothetical protein
MVFQKCWKQISAKKEDYFPRKKVKWNTFCQRLIEFFISTPVLAEYSLDRIRIIFHERCKKNEK